jgi:hypothetical protein
MDFPIDWIWGFLAQTLLVARAPKKVPKKVD